MNKKLQNRLIEFFNVNKDYKLLSELEKVIGIRDRIKVIHLTCGTEYEVSIDRMLNKGGYGTRCPKKECKVRRTKQTHIDRYGYTCIFDDKEFRKQESIKSKRRFFDKLCASEDYDPLFSFEEYKGINHNKRYHFRCKKCGTEVESWLSSCRSPICRKCHPKMLSRVSVEEKEVANFIEDLGFFVKSSYKDCLSGNKEIDIFIPERNFGIEYDGLIWHSERFFRNSFHLIEKKELCEKEKITLLNIFSDEWKDKEIVVKDIIKQYLLSENRKRIKKYKFGIDTFPQNKIKNFFDKNSLLLGDLPKFKHCFSVESLKDEVISLSLLDSFEKSIKILNFACKLGYDSVYFFDKTIDFVFEKYKNEFETLIYEDDLRLSNEYFLKNKGFEHVKREEPIVFYTEGSIRYDKEQYKNDERSRKLYKIYDCGYDIYQYKMKEEKNERKN